MGVACRRTFESPGMMMQRPGGCASAASVGRRHLWHGWMLGTMQRNQILASSPEHTRACWTDANTCTKSEAMTNHDFYHFGRLLPAPATPSEAMAEDPKSETGKRGGLDAYLSAGCRIDAYLSAGCRKGACCSLCRANPQRIGSTLGGWMPA